MKRSGALKPPPYSIDRATLAREVVIETFRASGPGGHHVNKTNSALRLTHPPSGIVVIAQDSPSQILNRAIAFGRLVARLRTLNHVPKKRLATKPIKGSVERRLAEKQRQGNIKTRRRKVEEECYFPAPSYSWPRQGRLSLFDDRSSEADSVTGW
jgi:protein subunit release factor B